MILAAGTMRRLQLARRQARSQLTGRFVGIQRCCGLVLPEGAPKAALWRGMQLRFSQPMPPLDIQTNPDHRRHPVLSELSALTALLTLSTVLPLMLSALHFQMRWLLTLSLLAVVLPT
jgi:hypothetical protein